MHMPTWIIGLLHMTHSMTFTEYDEVDLLLFILASVLLTIPHLCLLYISGCYWNFTECCGFTTSSIFYSHFIWVPIIVSSSLFFLGSNLNTCVFSVCILQTMHLLQRRIVLLLTIRYFRGRLCQRKTLPVYLFQDPIFINICVSVCILKAIHNLKMASGLAASNTPPQGGLWSRKILQSLVLTFPTFS